MENASYIALSRQAALREQMTIISNNVANMNTAGYRSQNMLFKEYMAKDENVGNPVSMVLDYGQYTSAVEGPLKQTGSPYDVALQGPGYFGVQTAEGVQYTRAGQFHVNAEGILVTAAGQPVMGEGGGQISIPKEVKNLTIGRDGSVIGDQGSLGKLMISEFDNIQMLKPAGNGLYKTDVAGTPATDTVAVQGMLEGSNVQPVVEMSRMIEVLRDYQSVQHILENEHERGRATIRRLTQQS